MKRNLSGIQYFHFFQHKKIGSVPNTQSCLNFKIFTPSNSEAIVAQRCSVKKVFWENSQSNTISGVLLLVKYSPPFNLDIFFEVLFCETSVNNSLWHLVNIFTQCRSSNQRCFVKQMSLKFSQNSQGSTCVGVSLDSSEACNFFKKETPA